MKKLLISLFLYFIAGAILFRYYQFYAVTDIVPHLDIAKKYLSGNFWQAVNGTWSVLISWLLVPFLLMNFKPFIAFKLLNFLLGGASISVIWQLSKYFKLSATVEWVIMICLVPMTISFAFIHTTADMLAAFLVSLYLAVIFSGGISKKVRSALWLGTLGGLAYLAKYYFFYFILLHLPLSYAFKYWSASDSPQRKKIFVNFFVSFAVFLIISMVWAGILTHKYGFFTVGTSANYNYALVAPGSHGHAPENLGLTAPPNSSANSMWEDLTYYYRSMPNYNWAPFSSFANFKFQLNLILRNTFETFKIYNKFAMALGPLVVVAIIVYLIKLNKPPSVLNDPIFMGFVVIIISSGGYLFIMTSDRYLWINCYLLLLSGGFFLEFLRVYLAVRPRLKWVYVLALAVFTFSFSFTPVRRLLINIDDGKNVYIAAQQLAKLNVAGRIASNKRWSDTSILSFYLGTKYYGLPAKDLFGGDLLNNLRDHKINYYLVWDRVVAPFASSTPFAKLTEITVYRIE